ncbi:MULTISPECIES: alpha/beta fold hydrolase [Ramlibacter]|uniref:Alpha/beta hydrolase n=1 Tax=Ramlibacter aquaticus TaxID=2780094 RepID=A0ABR9SGI4_9BURK|nr:MULTISPECIES: alpha/beta fold hydrolase [Ramlibacter]MBE7941472.1 alpha/beta hydrolase [Ramlibacter aquaticus]
MADYVLVHGAWHGAWCWNRVLPALWRAGHRAFAVSLTGTGEKAHLLSPAIRLHTHVQDVVAAIEAEELADCILVGHSYGGMAITGAAELCGERIGQLVYLDAMVPLDGECWSSSHDEATRASRRAAIAQQGALPPPDPAVFGLAGEDAAWVQRRQRPHPGGVYDDPLQFDAARWASFPRTFIDCVKPPLATIAESRRRVRTQPGWTLHTLQTGHDPMVSAPGELTALLLGLAA